LIRHSPFAIRHFQGRILIEVTLLAITQYLEGAGGPEGLIEYAGRVCYRSEGYGNTAVFIRARLRDGHESIVEHAAATFEVNGISRACSHQLVRHRLASFSQESQRYVEMTEPDWALPPALLENPEAVALWERFAEQVTATYEGLRALGLRKEDARFVLPNAAATRIIVTMNFRELRHFFRLRLAREAQWEIRELAQRMLELVRPHAPTIFAEFEDPVT